jgi:hypothetical protein
VAINVSRNSLAISECTWTYPERLGFTAVASRDVRAYSKRSSTKGLLPESRRQSTEPSNLALRANIHRDAPPGRRTCAALAFPLLYLKQIT